MPDIYQVNEAYRNKLRAREDSALAEMRRTYAVLQADNLQRLEELTQAIERAQSAGEDITGLSEYMLRLEALNVQMADQVALFAPQATDIATNGQRRAIQLSLDIQEDLVRAVAGVPQSVSLTADLMWNRLPVEAITNVVGFAADGSPLAALYEAIGPFARDHVTIGVAQGLNPLQVARRMSKTYETLAPSRAATIARTEMIRANREAQRQTFEANLSIVQGWRRISAGDVNVCPVCWSLHGDPNPVADVVPSHPNCRCTVIPICPTYAELAGLPPESFDEPEEMPDKDEQFRMLSELERRQVLGPSRYRLYETGTPLSAFGKVVPNAEWGPQAVVVPVKEL
jgi:SPP1 gp7 family putative phage head morphogenesis protein